MKQIHIRSGTIFSNFALSVSNRRALGKRGMPTQVKSGCGSQHSIAYACVLLAAAPTTVPCIRHWRRSLSLQAIPSPALLPAATGSHPSGHLLRAFPASPSRQASGYVKNLGSFWKQALEKLFVNFRCVKIKLIERIRPLTDLSKALPLGELAAKQTERARPFTEEEIL